MRWATIILWGMGILMTGGFSVYGQRNIEVTGLGYFKNRSFDARLSFLLDADPDAAVELSTPILEDSAFLIIEQAKREGNLKPVVEGHFFTMGTEERVVRWKEDYSIQLEAGFVADEARYRVIPGVLYYYDTVWVSGVGVIPADVIERFFIPGGVLFQGKKARVFTHDNLERRIGRLLRALDELGYRAAKVERKELKIDDVRGGVQLELEVDEGLLFRVGAVSIEMIDGEEAEDIKIEGGGLLTRDWEQENRQKLRNYFYERGYPDARVTMETGNEWEEGNTWIRDLRFVVHRGPKIVLGGVEYIGDEETKRSVLNRQIELKEEEPLNPIEINEARRKLMGLGIYREVGVELKTIDEGRRSVEFSLQPNERKELELLLGWGSYELGRAGFHWEHRNPWGHAHRYEVEVKQSFKATQADATYSIPQIFGTTATSYVNTGYSMREELSFDRSTYGVALGMSTLLGDGGTRVAVEYGYNREVADRAENSTFETEENARVASLSIRVSTDTRDDVFAPTGGRNLYLHLKGASALIGGDVDFLKVELGGSYHFALTESMLVHLGSKGGTILVSGGARDEIPFNERFFMGGENTIRGYREGGASPLDEAGGQVGSETYVLGNFELEQRMFMQLSLVAFVDVVGNLRDGLSKGESEWLYSVGLGLRYNTIVGPLRLEYGYNPERRDGDPRGTLHFSIGFPF